MSAPAPQQLQQNTPPRLHSQVPDALLKTRGFDSLDAVCATARDVCGGHFVGARQPIMRCNADFFNYVHHNQKSDYTNFPAHFDACHSSAPPTPAARKTHPVFTLAAESVLGAKSGSFMAPMCSPLTLASCSRYLRGALQNRTTADPSKSDYYVMEKSDGLRVVMVTQTSYNFPQWRILRRDSAPQPHSASTTTSPTFIPFPSLGVGLRDVAQLEKALLEVREKEATKANETSWTSMSISDRMVKRVVESSQFRLSTDATPFVLRRITQGLAEDAKAARSQLGEDASTTELLVLVQKTDMGDGVELLIHRRLANRHFSYVFDRTMSDVYLLNDEIPFSGISHAVLDGELILTAPVVEQQPTKIPSKGEMVDVIALRMKRQLLFAIFDIFSYSSIADDVARKSADAPHPSPPHRKEEMRELCRASMWERYTAIDQVVLAPMYAALGAASHAQRLPISLSITPFRKQMWPIERLPECINLITAVPTKDLPEAKVMKVLSEQAAAKKGAAAATAVPNELLDDEVTYLFANKSYNDGLIFTPANFDVVSGSRADQLKWKFPDKLTVDWTITRILTRFDKKDKDAYITHAERGDTSTTKKVNAPASSITATDGVPNREFYKIEMFFRRKAMNMVPELSGTSEYHRSRPLLNPHGFSIPDTHGIVAECSFLPKEGKWCIERLRRDKTESNSVHTVISVLESIAEKIDVLKLMRVLSFVPILSPTAAFGLPLQHLSPPAAAASAFNAQQDDDEDDGVTTAEERQALKNLKGAMTHIASQCNLVKRCLLEERSSLDAFLQTAQDALTASSENAETEGTTTTAQLLPAYPTTAYLSVRNSRSGGVTLQWQVKLQTQRNPIAANQCRVKECYGLGEPCPEELGWGEDDGDAPIGGYTGAQTNTVRSNLKEKLLVELGNQGGSVSWSDTVVECLYDPTRGRWALVGFPTLNISQTAELEKTIASGIDEELFSPEIAELKSKRDRNITKNQTYATQLIQHLEAVCTYVYNNSAIVDFWTCVNVMKADALATTTASATTSSDMSPVMKAFIENPLPFPLSVKNAFDKLSSKGSSAAEGEEKDEVKDLEKLKAQLADAHYAQRTRELHHERKLESPLRCFNNWVKMMLMQRALIELKPRADCLPFMGIPNYHPGFATFEVCCGRGGDLFKWKPLLQSQLPQETGQSKAAPGASTSSSSAAPRGDVSGSFLFMADVCEEAVAEAASRYSCAPGLSTKIPKGKDGYPGIPAYFFVEDCFSDRMIPTIEKMKVVVAFERRKKHAEDVQALKLSNAMLRGGAGQKRARVDVGPDGKDIVVVPTTETTATAVVAARPEDAGGFDFVATQFCIHYAFHSKESVRRFLGNVSAALRPGGLFFGTTVDDNTITSRRAEHGDVFGNDHYKVSFTSRLGGEEADRRYAEEEVQPLPTSQFGTPYSIQVENAVSGEVEYTVPWGAFVSMCADEFNLDVVGEASLNFEKFAKTAWEQSNEVGTKLYKESFKGVLGDAGKKKSVTATTSTAEVSTGEKSSPQEWLEAGGTREAAYLYKTFMFRKRVV